MRGQPHAHRVDQTILLVAGLEVDLAADRGHPDRVAVVADSGDHALEQVARAPRSGRLAEPQRVEHGDRAGAHREHVAEDPADPGGRPLERLDRARMVVRLDLEGDGEAVSDIDRAGVLARADEDVPALGRQAAQELLGVLVGAVLGPHQRQHRELDVAGFATQAGDDQFVLVVGEPELPVFGLGTGGQRAHASGPRWRDRRRRLASTRRSSGRRSSPSAGRPRARDAASGQRHSPRR